MPLVRIDLPQGKTEAFRRTVGDVVYDAMVAELKAPWDDRWQVITEHSAANLVAGGKDCIVIQLFLMAGRSAGQKRAFYKAVADGLHDRFGQRREDLFIGLVEVQDGSRYEPAES